MAHFTAGYVLLARTAIERYARDPEGFMILCHIISQAKWRADTEYFNGHQVHLERGQLVTSAGHLAAFHGLTESKVKRIIKELVSKETIREEVNTRKYRILTIVNYDSYQGLGPDKETSFTSGYPFGRQNAQTSNCNESDKSAQVDASGRGVNDNWTINERYLNDNWTINGRQNGRQNDSVTNINEREKHDQVDDGGRQSERYLNDNWTINERSLNDKWPTISNTENQSKAVKQKADTEHAVPAVPKAAKVTFVRPRDVERVWDAYSQAMLQSHAAMPPRPGKLNKQMLNLVKAIGPERAAELADYYVRNEKTAWIVQARHPFGELLLNVQKYDINMQTGFKVTKIVADNIERNDHYADMEHRVMAKMRAEGEKQ